MSKWERIAFHARDKAHLDLQIIYVETYMNARFRYREAVENCTSSGIVPPRDEDTCRYRSSNASCNTIHGNMQNFSGMCQCQARTLMHCAQRKPIIPWNCLPNLQAHCSSCWRLSFHSQRRSAAKRTCTLRMPFAKYFLSAYFAISQENPRTCFFHGGVDAENVGEL